MNHNFLTTENTEFTEEGTEKKNSLDAHIIGQIQLEGAIDHYNQGNYICAITLARAAEEYLGKLLDYSSNKKEIKALDRLTSILSETAPEKFDLNYIANNLKHFDKNFLNTSYNLKFEAVGLIIRALRNHITLRIPLTQSMDLFFHSNKEIDLNDLGNPTPIIKGSAPSLVQNTNEDINAISGKIINCAINVHKQLGPGLLERAYQHGMDYMMAKEGLKFSREKVIPIMIDNHRLDDGYRADFIVENQIVIETKSVEKLNSIHEAQILNYMRLGKFSVGLLMNFNQTLLKNGLKRFKI